jgi:hypothetical protein
MAREPLTRPVRVSGQSQVRRGGAVLSVASGTVKDMENEGALDLLHGVLAYCADCEGEQILIPVDRSGGFCCTLCDGGIFLSEVVVVDWARRRDRAA